uniref:Uncharacterized protein n=1 Tax=Setaria viridis TaxID=4556 RepID=A0A4U6SZZ6_SETVI|nr:hypothetical protein SEVIR_9G277850v2 [Setaria viridis]
MRSLVSPAVWRQKTLAFFQRRRRGAMQPAAQGRGWEECTGPLNLDLLVASQSSSCSRRSCHTGCAWSPCQHGGFLPGAVELNAEILSRAATGC